DRQRRERATLRRLRDLIHLREARAVEIAEPLLRPAELRVDCGKLGDAGRAEDLAAPEELLCACGGDEPLERVRRPPAGRRTGPWVRVRVAAAEGATGVNERLLRLVERREQPLDVARRTERLAARRPVVGREDA